MGGGSWTSTAYVTHSTTTRGYASMDAFMAADTQSLYKARGLDEALNPKNVVRECRDSEEHPNSLPVILALDVTGSMGSAATEIAKKLDVIMQDIFKKDLGRDVEFCVMAVGDQVCDSVPYQVSQFESDIRIAEALEKIYFEGCGGGNSYESYTGAWLWANDRTRCDCWARGGKGVIITMGDELPTTALSREHAKDFLGSLPDDDLLNGQKRDLEPEDILAHVSKKWMTLMSNGRESLETTIWFPHWRTLPEISPVSFPSVFRVRPVCMVRRLSPPVPLRSFLRLPSPA